MLVGIVLLVLPGPGWLLIFSGLVVLGSEFTWARKLSDEVRVRFGRFIGRNAAEGPSSQRDSEAE